MDSVYNKVLKSFCITVYVSKYHLSIIIEVFVDNGVDVNFLNRIDTLTETAAAVNSNLGMETNLVGATLHFPITRQQGMLPFSFTSQRYDTCP